MAKSGSAVAYFYRRHNELPEAQFIALQDIYSSIPPNVTKVVFIDDFVGSGHASVTLWSEAVPLLKRMARIKTFILGCITAYEIGIAYAASKT